MGYWLPPSLYTSPQPPLHVFLSFQIICNPSEPFLPKLEPFLVSTPQVLQGTRKVCINQPHSTICHDLGLMRKWALKRETSNGRRQKEEQLRERLWD